jgi:hypothetical protein
MASVPKSIVGHCHLLYLRSDLPYHSTSRVHLLFGGPGKFSRFSHRHALHFFLVPDIFLGSIQVVYKKQILYVYTPCYESGGSFFPDACDRTLFGLMCGQLTLIGYTTIRQSYYEPIWLLPLPVFTVWVMTYFRKHYADASITLSMERAMECDRISDLKASMAAGVPHEKGLANRERARVFDREAYRQPVLGVHAMEPMPYRRGTLDTMTKDSCSLLRELNGYANMSGDMPVAFTSHFEDASTEREIM